MKKKVVKAKVCPCILCGLEHESDYDAVSCLWIHIFKKDKYFRILSTTSKKVIKYLKPRK